MEQVKITDEQLKNIQQVQANADRITRDLAQNALAQAGMVAAYNQVQDAYQQITEALVKEFGEKAQIDSVTGLVTYPVLEEIENK